MSAEEELNQERRITFCMYECWEKLAEGAGLPALKSMNRDEISPFKKNLVLIDLRNGHENPTFQVIGSDLQEDLDEDLSNKHVSSVPRRTMLSRVTDHYLEVLANRVPIAFEAEFVNTDGEKALYRGILLPFSDDGENINFILGGVRWILEKDVTLDDSKPTIEELMRSISNGREDAPDQYDEAAIAAEQNTSDMAAENDVDHDAAQDDSHQQTATSTDSLEATAVDNVSEDELTDREDTDMLNDETLCQDNFDAVGDENEGIETSETEDLMSDISGEREDEAAQDDETAVTTEQDTPDLTAENDTDHDAAQGDSYQPPATATSTDSLEATAEDNIPEELRANYEDADTLNNDTTSGEDDFDVVREEDEPVITVEDAAEEVDLSAEPSVEVEKRSDELDPAEDSAQENKTSVFSDAPGITRKDFLPAAEDETAEELEDEPDLISDVEEDLLVDPEQNDESEIFGETDQSDEILFDDQEQENDLGSNKGNFAEIFDAEEDTKDDEALSETENDLTPIEEDSLSFVESLEKELYSHTDELDTEEELVLGETEESSDDTPDEIPSSVGVNDLEAEAILETSEDTDDSGEVPLDTASTNDDPDEVLSAENAAEFAETDGEAHVAKSTSELTLNELLSQDTSDDAVADTEAEPFIEEPSLKDVQNEGATEEDIAENAAIEVFDEPDGSLVKEHTAGVSSEEEEANDLVLDDEYLEIEDSPAFEDEIVEGLIDVEDLIEKEDTVDEHDIELSAPSAEVNESAPETGAVIQNDAASTDDLSIEELMESIISERRFEQSHEVKDHEESGEIIKETVSSDSSITAAVEENESANSIVEEDIVEESTLEDDVDEERTIAEDVEEEIILEEDVVEESSFEDATAESHEVDNEKDLTENSEDDSVNEAEKDQTISDTPPVLDDKIASSDEGTVDSLSTEEEGFENDAQASIIEDTAQQKPKKTSVIERAMAMMAPTLSPLNKSTEQDSPDLGVTENTDENITIEDTSNSENLEDVTSGSTELTEDEISIDSVSEEIDSTSTLASSQTPEEDISVNTEVEPGQVDHDPDPNSENDESLADVADGLVFEDPEKEDYISTQDEPLAETESDVSHVVNTPPADDPEIKSIQELRATLKQIVGYIKKEDKNHNRSRDSLYNILTAIYEFHDTCEGSPDAFNTIVKEHDLRVQSRAPFTPVLKICLGKDYDKTRLTEYAAALGIARYMSVDVSEFHAFIKNFPGGIKGCVKEMRAIRKHGTSGNITARKTRSVEEAREILRDMAPIASFRLKKIIVGNNIDEFCLLLAKRDGHDINVLKILDEKYTKLDPIIKRAAFIKGNLNDRK